MKEGRETLPGAERPESVNDDHLWEPGEDGMCVLTCPDGYCGRREGHPLHARWNEAHPIESDEPASQGSGPKVGFDQGESK